MSSAASRARTDQAGYKWMLVAIITVGIVFALLSGNDAPDYRTVSRATVACPTVDGLEAVVMAAKSGKRSSIYKPMLINLCLPLEPGTRIEHHGYGGLFWWRARIAYKGNMYHVPRGSYD